MFVRDVSGARSLFVDRERARDEGGKVVAVRAGSDAETRQLTSLAAARMGGGPVLMSDRPVLMDLGPGDVANAATVAEVGIPAGDYLADEVSRVRFITHDRGVWYVENALDAIRVVPASLAATGSPAEINPNYASTTFVAAGYGLAAKLPRQVIADADFDLKRRAVLLLVEALQLQREVRVATLLTTSAHWAPSNVITVAAGSKWNGGAAANPLTDLFSALAASVLPGNRLVLPESTAPFFFQNAHSTALRDYVQSGGELPRVLFARAKVQVAGAPAYVWAQATPSDVVLVRDPGSPDRIATSVTFRWLGQDGSRGEEADGLLVRQFWSDADDAYYVVVSHYDYEALVSNVVGALIVGAQQ